MLKRYLGWTEDDIQMNETMLKQERAIDDFTEFDEMQQIYDPAIYGERKVDFPGQNDEGMIPGMTPDLGGNPPGEAPIPPAPIGGSPDEDQGLPPAA
jgi:hypothetical protein